MSIPGRGHVDTNRHGMECEYCQSQLLVVSRPAGRASTFLTLAASASHALPEPLTLSVSVM
eukprot:3705320-Prymnesium_polylepis.1